MTKYRLLIVDDEALIRQGLCARIQYFQFRDVELVEAASGGEALEIFRQGGVDLALVDISMPDMSGLELIGKAREISPATRFVVLSGFAEFAYAQQAILLGVRAYLNKPVSNDELCRHLEAILQELREESEASGAAGEEQAAFDPEKEINILLSGDRRGSNPAALCPGLCERYPMLFDGKGQVYLAILHIGKREIDKPRLTVAQLNSIRPLVKSIFEESVCGCERLIVESYQNPQRLYALFMMQGSADLRLQVENVFLKVRQEFERRASARITMGVSRLSAVLSAESVADARMALRQRNVSGRSNIYFYEDVAALETQPFPEAELELLRKNMTRGDRVGVQRQLDKLLSEKQMAERRAVYLHVLWVRIVSMMMHVCGDADSGIMNRLLSQISRVDMMMDRDEILHTLSELMDVCMSRDAGREMNTADKIGYALEYIREHFNEEIVINDLAARLDMSPGYFSSTFKKEVGQSTMQYITALRIERAKEYLSNTDWSVAVIAKDVGYTDSQYFFRVFKKTTGITPLQYRQDPRAE